MASTFREDPKSSEWVAGRFTAEQAKFVSGMAHEGVGYYMLEQPDRGTGWIVAAFRRAIDGSLPDHLVRITDREQIRKLEEWRTRAWRGHELPDDFYEEYQRSKREEVEK